MAAIRQSLARFVREGRNTTRSTLAWNKPLAFSMHASQLRVGSVRGFGSKGINGVNGLNGVNGVNGVNGDGHDGDDDAFDDGLSPFERLLQHSKQFRDEVGLEELPEEIESEFLTEDEEVDDEGDHSEEPLERDDQDARDEDDKRHSSRATIDHDLTDTLEEREEDHAEFVNQIRRPIDRLHERFHQLHPHDANADDGDEEDEDIDRKERRQRTPRETRYEIESRVRRDIARADDVDFEHGLRDLDPRRAQNKMYVQLLTRESDSTRVCQNCGEMGHVARNCMLPTICSICGDVGHRQSECPHRWFTAKQLALTRTTSSPSSLTKSSKMTDKQKSENRRRVELEAIRERHERMKKAFDAEIDEYVDRYASMNKNRKDKLAARKAAAAADGGAASDREPKTNANQH